MKKKYVAVGDGFRYGTWYTNGQEIVLHEKQAEHLLLSKSIAEPKPEVKTNAPATGKGK